MWAPDMRDTLRTLLPSTGAEIICVCLSNGKTFIGQAVKPLRPNGQCVERNKRLTSLDCARTRHVTVKTGAGVSALASVASLNCTGATAQTADLAAPPFPSTHRTRIRSGFGDRLPDNLCVSFNIENVYDFYNVTSSLVL